MNYQEAYYAEWLRIMREKTMSTAAAKKGLGKGLSALMSDVAPPQVLPMEMTPGAIHTLPVGLLQAGQFQPRRQFDAEALHELADSIEKNGIMQPIVVRGIGGGRYEIIAGERRFRAAQLAKLSDVPVIVRDDVGDAHALELALIENIQRADLNPVEEAAGYRRLMDEFRYTQEKLASVVGKSRSHIANLLRLLELPEAVKQLIDRGQLSMGHARALVGLPNAEALAKTIVAEGLSVREVEALMGGKSAKQGKEKPLIDELADQVKNLRKPPEIAEIEQMLMENLGLAVSLNRRSNKSGEVVISYETLAELDEILRRLSGTMY